MINFLERIGAVFQADDSALFVLFVAMLVVIFNVARYYVQL